MLLSFSGISTVTMLILVANLCVQLEGAKSQKKPKSLIDSRKGEVHVRSSITKHKPVHRIAHQQFSYGSVGSKNSDSTWRHDNLPKVAVNDYTLQTVESHAPGRHERKHKTLSEKMQNRKTAKRNKRRTERSYRPSRLQNRRNFKKSKESALAEVLIIHHRNKAQAKRVKNRRFSFVNTEKTNRKHIFHNFDTFRELTGNQIIPNFVPSNPGDEVISYSSNIDPDKVYDQRMNNENYLTKPLKQINFRPNTYNGIKNTVANPSFDINARQRMNHQARTYYQPSFHELYEQPMPPDYRSFESLDYDSKPGSHFFPENYEYPLRYQKELSEDSLEQNIGPHVADSVDKSLNGHNLYQYVPGISQSLLHKDRGVDTQILNMDAVEPGNQYQDVPGFSQSLLHKDSGVDTQILNTDAVEPGNQYQDVPGFSQSLLHKDSGVDTQILNTDAVERGNQYQDVPGFSQSLLHEDSGVDTQILNTDAVEHGNQYQDVPGISQSLLHDDSGVDTQILNTDAVEPGNQYQDVPGISQSLLHTDNGVDTQILNTDAAVPGNQHQDVPGISQSLLHTDSDVDSQIQNTDAVERGNQYGEYKPKYSNGKLLSNQHVLLDTAAGENNITFPIYHKLRPEKVDHLGKKLISDTSENEYQASEYQLLSNKTGVPEPIYGNIGSGKAKEILKKVLKDIQNSDEFQEFKRGEFVCSVNGSWVSESGGVRIELTQIDDRNLRVTVDKCVPPRYNGIICKDWTFTGSVPPDTQDSGLFTISGYSPSKKKVGVFLGQCHSCGGDDLITGTWLIGRKARNCKDTHLTINEVRDVWRKEMLYSLLTKHRKKGKHKEKSNTTTTPNVNKSNTRIML